MKNKTWATWLAFLGGPLGLHRFYLYGRHDNLGWLLPIPSALGLWGILRVQTYGIDDSLSWWLLPIFGFAYAACALNAIVMGLTSCEVWNKKFNPQAPKNAAPGQTSWTTIFGIVLSLIVGATVLISSIVYGFQRYFESQIDEAHQIADGLDQD
jgi:hypothetical protein